MRTSRLDQLRLLGYVVDEYHDDEGGVHVAGVRGFGIATMVDLTHEDVDVAVASLANMDAHTERVTQFVASEAEVDA